MPSFNSRSSKRLPIKFGDTEKIHPFKEKIILTKGAVVFKTGYWGRRRILGGVQNILASFY